jgi:hypothetical protein
MLKTMTLAGILMLSTLSLAHANGVDRAYSRVPLAERAGLDRAPVHHKPFAHAHKHHHHHGHHHKKACSCKHAVKSGDKAKIEVCKKHKAARKAHFEQRMKQDPAFAKKMQERKIKWHKHHRLEPIPAH